MKEVTKALADDMATLELGLQLAHDTPGGLLVFLEGPLGAGKTSFARGFLRGLGFVDKVKSPTYTLVEPYEVDGRFVFHFDLYRVNTADELLSMGIQDYFFPEAICLVEWPEKGAPYLPTPDITCRITFFGEGRKAHLEAHSERGEAVLRDVEGSQEI